MGRLTRGPICAAATVLPVAGLLLLLFILAPFSSSPPFLLLPFLSSGWSPASVTELVKVVAGDRALSPEKTRGAHGGMFVKGDAFGVCCVAVVLGTGSEVGGAPISRGISGAGAV
jgi:hypothetical protein